MDRRTKSRIDVQLTCYVDAGRVEAEPVRAITENVSRTGVLMRWADGIPLPRVERKMTLDLQLPENSEFGPRVMRCRTEVTRVSPVKGNCHEVALRVLSMRFVKRKRQIRVSDLASMPLPVNRIV
ncbi:MAG TPA: PilZ domain-containing protein [Bryobacteraceae bacterium]|jgi:c-di-GMP-binding flagellar brake protein YcgR